MTPVELNSVLVGMIDQVVSHLLPNGKKIGRSWCVGSINGEPGQSLRVCMSGARTGLWSDFSTNGGGDLLQLWQDVRGITFIEVLKEAKEFAGVTDDTHTLVSPTRKKKKPVVKPKCTKPLGKVEKWFKERGITEKSLTAYKVGQVSGIIVFPFISPGGKLEMVKFRDLAHEEKTGKKKIWSNEDPDYHLWGWQAIPDNARSVVICEGEPDALSWFEQGYPALSVPQGADGGDKQRVWIENDFDRLERFEAIYLSMDMDKSGQEAVGPIIRRLGQDRCRVVDLGAYKDGNEVHIDGKQLGLFIENAKTRDPEELKRLIDHHEEILNEFDGVGVIGSRLPWQRTHGDIRLRPAEISIWAGINSHGKSVALSHVAVDLVAQSERVCIASMEMKPRKLGRKMYQQAAGSAKPSQAQEREIIEFFSDNLWLFEVFGTAKASRILEVFSYARKRYGITHFIVDSLAKCGFAEDDYNAQKDFVDELMEFAGKNDVHVHLVVHIRKSENERKVPGKMDVKGTGAITDMVDNVFIWWRNKVKEEKVEAGDADHQSPDAVFNCVKQRETGEEPCIGLYFNKASCQFLDTWDEPPKQYLFSG